MNFSTLFRRALLLRCPYCGEGKLFDGWLHMRPTCSHCGLKFEREPGFFLGSIYINYGITSLIVAIGYPALLFNEVASKNTLLYGSLAFVTVLPLLLFRHARSLWLGFDQWRDPRAPGDA